MKRMIEFDSNKQYKYYSCCARLFFLGQHRQRLPSTPSVPTGSMMRKFDSKSQQSKTEFASMPADSPKITPSHLPSFGSTTSQI